MIVTPYLLTEIEGNCLDKYEVNENEETPRNLASI
jgi:hypothetical protein